MRSTSSALALCLALGGCVVTATQPPDPSPSPTGTATAEPAPTATATGTDTPTQTGTGDVCGGLTGAACAAGQFCDFPISAMCGAADATGTCRTKPEICTREYAPVCGCDGQTYPNACAAAAAGQSVQKQGKCDK